MIGGLNSGVLYLDQFIEEVSFVNKTFPHAKKGVVEFLKSVSGSLVAINNIMYKYRVDEEVYKTVEKSITDSMFRKSDAIERSRLEGRITYGESEELQKSIMKETPRTVSLYAGMNVGPPEERRFEEEDKKVKTALRELLNLKSNSLESFALGYRSVNKIYFCGERIKQIIR